MISGWLANNYIELFGAVTGIIFVIFEIRQIVWLWPLGILTSGTYIWIFYSTKFYADMSLQVYYLVISILGWYWWSKGRRGDRENGRLVVTRLKKMTGLVLLICFVILYIALWLLLSRFTDSPVPEWDSFLTSLSIIATWMLARKIFEHWYLWIIVNSVSSFVFYLKGLYPTVGLYIIYLIMSFVGLREWMRSIGRQASGKS